MVSLEFCVGCFLVFAILQLLIGCSARIWANGVLFDPVIKSKKNLQGYYAIVTGSNQGIGYQVAKYLVNHGAYVVMACRNDERGKKAEKSINDEIKLNAIYKGGKAEYIKCDLSKLESTKTFIEKYKNKGYGLHILVNNGGLGGRDPPKFTKDNINMVWQINYLSHFLITYELLPIMIKSVATNHEFDGRIINTSSIWHNKGYIDIDILESDKEIQIKEFKHHRIDYGTSKLAQILHATHLQQFIFTNLNIPISICSLHPGGVRTNIFKTSHWKIHMKLILYLLYPAWLMGLRNTEQGSRNTIYCCIAPIGKQIKEWGGEFIPGAYHINMTPDTTKDIEGQSTDPKVMKKLYQYSLNILKLQKRTKEDYQRLMKYSTEKHDIDDDDDDDDDKKDDFKPLKDGIVVLTNKDYWFYSIIDAEWNKISDLNETQKCNDHPSILMNENIIYRIGGRNIESDECMKYCDYLRLDRNIKEWERMNGEINERRCSAGSIFLGEHLLVIGGDDNGDELKTMEEYDFNANKWNLRASMNERRNDFGICSINNNELLVVGGHSVDAKSGISGYLDSIEKYNYNLNKWITLNIKLPNGVRARCGAYHWNEYKSNNIIIAGGTSPNRNIVECLDLEKMEWIKFPKLRNCHWWPQIGTLSTEQPQILYVVGLNEKNILDVVEYIDVRQNTKKWNTQNIIQHSKLKKINAMCWV